MTPREQTERALIGCVLIEPELAAELRAEWFDDLRLAEILNLTTGLLGSGKAIGAATLVHQGADFGLIREAEEQCHSAANFQYWRDDLIAAAERSRLLKAAQHFISLLPSCNGELRTHIAALENALAKPMAAENKTLTPKDCADGLINHLETRFNLQGKRSGLETGFVDLDRISDGLQFGEVTILAARPSVGKTAIACNLVERVCLRDKIPTLFLSLEMSAPALCRRLLSGVESIAMQDLKSGRLSELDMAKVAKFNETLKASPLYIRESFGGMSAQEAASLIRRGVARKGIKLVVLDYLQKLKPGSKHEKRTYEIAETSAVMVEAVKQSGVAFVCLAQLNRENEKDKGRTPRLSDLADSGQIERDADNVFLLHRKRGDNPHEAQLIVAKQRDGETGLINLFFEGKYCKFHSEEKHPVQEPHND